MSAAGPEPLPGSAGALEAIRELVRADLEAVDAAIRSGLKSVVPLVDQIAEHIIAGGGKRLRPLLVVLAGRACRAGSAVGGAAGSAAHIQAAAFIEFIHTATLLHDDVVDMSALRRGRDTANEVFGNQASVLVGDFVYSRAFQMMAAVRSQRVIEIMAEATNIIAEGEVLQLMNARDPGTTEQRYLEVIHRKTAQLFQAGAEVAAVVSDATPDMQRALARYGKHLGTAYQLIDDVLDYQSDPQTRGKNLGDDLAEGKPTLPLIHALRSGDPEIAAVIRAAIVGGGREQLGAILAAIESTGGLEYTARLAQSEADQALAALAALPVTPFRTGLAALARFAIERKH
ncbi:MAG: polyprenyl synthetase family protein [Gammaproteobacteria bacterium]|nr:polyprenyl synthetase family protein [Gammaproteobacteria bacterium]MDE2251612.1 polyprenyl synthetase family protein [Gammaproteobacteria bacterium]